MLIYYRNGTAWRSSNETVSVLHDGTAVSPAAAAAADDRVQLHLSSMLVVAGWWSVGRHRRILSFLRITASPTGPLQLAPSQIHHSIYDWSAYTGAADSEWWSLLDSFQLRMWTCINYIPMMHNDHHASTCAEYAHLLQLVSYPLAHLMHGTQGRLFQSISLHFIIISHFAQSSAIAHKYKMIDVKNYYCCT